MRLPDPNDSSLHDLREEQDEHAALRMIWLVFAGWWLSALWVAIAWFTILLPFARGTGFWMIARLPLLVSLKPAGDEYRAIVENTLARIEHKRLKQRPCALRCFYCLAFGWWLSIGWATVAWAESLSPHKQTKPLMMFMRLPAVMTLQRY